MVCHGTGRAGWLAVILLDLGTYGTVELMLLFNIFVGSDHMGVTWELSIIRCRRGRILCEGS